jgi:hypothetical protein
LPVESQKRITFPAVDNGRLAQTKVYYAAAEVMNKETIYREREREREESQSDDNTKFHANCCFPMQSVHQRERIKIQKELGVPNPFQDPD